MLAVGLALGAVGASLPAPVAASPARATARPQAPEAAPPPSPLVGDFDGDGRDDQLWYGPGAAPDHAWFGRGDRGFTGRALTVAGAYLPLVADFDGDGRDDVLWYGAGAAADYLWLGTAGKGFVGRSVRVNGTYRPIVGDFDGDRRADVLWYSPTASDRVWYGGAGGFTSVKVSVAREYTPVVGDFDANGTSDVLWYGPGGRRDYLWRGTWARTFWGVSVTVNGTYDPVVGDFDGDGPDDVYWHRGDRRGVLWSGRRWGGFVGRSRTGATAATPFVADFDGDGVDDLAWNDSGIAGDRVWYGGPGGFAERAITVGGSFLPAVGDFDGDRRDDVFWFGPGDERDALWFAGPGRAFVSRPSALDPLPGPGTALRQDVWASQMNPYGYVAHALGPTPPDPYGREFGYSNTLEAFEHNLARGFRVFEADFVRLADGNVLAAHNGTERRYGLPAGVSFRQATRAQVGSYTVGGAGDQQPNHFTPLFAEDIVDLLIAHPDVSLVLDTKMAHVAIVRRFAELAAGHPGLMDRIMPHVAGQADLDALRRIYPIRNYVLALYRTQAFNRFDDPEVVRFVRDNRVPAVMMWWGTRNPGLTLKANMDQQRRYTSAFAAQLRAAGAVVYVHSLGDGARVQQFTGAGVGVYSNGPFPPFTIEPEPIEPPVEAGVPLV